MEALLIIFVLGLMAVIVIGSIMGMTSSGRISKLEQQNRNLNARLKILEAERGRAAQTVRPVVPAKPPIPTPAPTPPPSKPAIPVAAASASPTQRGPAVVTSKAGGRQIPPAPRPVSPKPISNKPAKPSRNLEELIGGQWSVWVGGLALLVGAVLLIRFTIEAGFFGPAARIFMAMGLGVVLLLAGEWLKRSDDKLLKGKLGQSKLGETAKALQSNASIPGLLSAIGVFSLLGAIYAAFALYDLIPATPAFIGLGIVSVGAMGLSLRQGPLLAAIGLLASMATPLLIQADAPNFMALVGYLLVIGVAALGIAHRTGWGWLASGTVFGWLGWSAMSVRAATSGQMVLWGVFLAIGFVVTVWLAERAKPIKYAKSETSLARLNLQPPLALLWGAVAAVLIMDVASQQTLRLGGGGGLMSSSLTLSILTLVNLFAASIILKRQATHLLTAGFLAIGLMTLTDTSGQKIVFAVAVAIAVILALREALSANGKGPLGDIAQLWPVAAIGLGLGSVGMSNEMGLNVDLNRAHAIWSLAYGAVFGAAAIYFQNKFRPLLMTVSLTMGAALAWWMGAALAFDGLAFSLAMSLGAGLCVAAIWTVRLQGARLALLALAGLVFAHAFLFQFPDPDSLSVRPIFNALWAYLALPTAILGAAGYILFKRGSDQDEPWQSLLSSVIEAAALAGVAIFAVFQIRHLSNGGEVYVDKIGFEELGLQVATGLCFTLAGLSKRFSGNLVLSKGAELISYVTLAIFGIGSLAALSPLFDGGQLIEGSLVFNSLATGLLVPTVLLGICAWRARGRRPDVYVNILGGLALAGGMSWITAMVRFIYNGAAIDIFDVNFGDLELWTISAIWLLAGIVLLAGGVWKRERALRWASGIIIIATVLKAFLVDMAGLEGVLRALSFVGLGLVLIVIGRAYQRFWLSDRPQNQPD